MSEQEFEVYLRLIAKLLRLSDKQREAISDELRDHMEARLDELMEGGMGREKAIHAAIEEFGDAAGLAEEFTQITRHYTLRRRIMRTSIGALAVAATIALTFLYLLPQHRPGVSGPADAFAQGADTSEEALVASTQEAAGTLQSLSKRITVDYNDTPLGVVFDQLRGETGVNIFVNWTVLEGVGIDKDYQVTLSLRDTSAHTVLALLFQLLNPALPEPIEYAVMDDVVVVATASEINDMRVVRIYDCLDLMHGAVAYAASGQAPAGMVSGGGMGGGYGAPGMGDFGGEMAMGGEGYGGGGGMGGGYGSADQPARTAGGRSVGRSGGAYGGYGMGGGMPMQQQAGELINVVETLLDDGGSVTSYDGMLVVIAGHKTHQRIQETLTMMRSARAQR
ncbi:MAG: hypothetical protein KDN05_22305 [Verrucomicrobiae bacterium]|nr:hypothetical protein [Verrucomicrobiae bacterium]